MSAESPRRFLFVCTGNTCRSVMAERLLSKLAADCGLGWEARSCGIAAESFFQVPPAVKKVLASAGAGGFEHQARLVTRESVEWADLVLVMCEEHKDDVVERYPDQRGKVHLLRAYAGLERPNIEDPIGQDDAVYEETQRQIREALEAVIRKLATAAGGTHP